MDAVATKPTAVKQERPRVLAGPAEAGRMQPATGNDGTGLTDAEAKLRLSRFGPNEFGAQQRKSVAAIAVRTLREPLFLILVVAAATYLYLGDIGEGAFMAASAVLSIGLVVFQEARSERSLEELRKLADPVARVLRAGVVRPLPSREIVPGDLLVLRPGDRIVADALLLDGGSLEADESALTGESLPVTKSPVPKQAPGILAEPGSPGEEGIPQLYAGSLVVAGQGMACVTSTGMSTELGRIGKLLVAVKPEPTRLEAAMRKIAVRLSFLALAFCLAMVLSYGLIRGDWQEASLIGITLAMALMPEEFPMVLAVFMTLGAWRLASVQVLTRRSSAIEALGATTVLCVDKTGTLTENRMRVVRQWTPQTGFLPAAADDRDARSQAVEVAAMACDVDGEDPMDQAVREAAGSPSPEGKADWSHPPTAKEPFLLQLWREGNGSFLAAKGAPEAVLKLCGASPATDSQVHAAVREMAVEGLRVLGVAKRRLKPEAADPSYPEGMAKSQLEFVGLLGFADPVRLEVPATVGRCAEAGIRVVMVTGDYPATASTIAAQAGLQNPQSVLTGSQVADCTDDDLRSAVRHVNVFARIQPEQKLRIVEALRDAGEVVAMTGDGVNDAPALKAAHIGIAMGKRGTDLAREAADLVLLDDRFSSVVLGIAAGRRIYGNLRKALVYVTSVHVPIAGLAVLPIVIGVEPLLLPMHVILMEMVIDPICSIAFEGQPEEDHAMRSPPRPVGERLFSWPQIGFGVLQGGGLLGVVVIGYLLQLRSGASSEHARSFAYSMLLVGNLALALSAIDRKVAWTAMRMYLPSLVIAGATFAAILASLYVPGLNSVLRMTPLSFLELGIAVAVAFVPLITAPLARTLVRSFQVSFCKPRSVANG